MRTLQGRLKVTPDGATRENARYLLLGQEGAEQPDPTQALALCANGALGQARFPLRFSTPLERVPRRSLRRRAALRHRADAAIRRYDRRFHGPVFDDHDIGAYLSAFPIRRT